MPPTSFHHHAVTTAPLRRVWDRLQDPAVWASVAGVDGTSGHTHNGASLTGFRFNATVAGVPYRGTARVTESTAAESMTLAIRSSEVQGIITVDLEEETWGTRLDVRIMLRPSGIIGPVVFGVISRAVEEGFGPSVERLAAELG